MLVEGVKVLSDGPGEQDSICSSMDGSHVQLYERTLRYVRDSRSLMSSAAGLAAFALDGLEQRTKSSTPIEVISMPSKMIFPDVGSVNRSRLIASVDLPLPVRPISPIFSPARISNDPLKTVGKSGAYLISTSCADKKCSPLSVEGQ
jgi:hypothetical protein